MSLEGKPSGAGFGPDVFARPAPESKPASAFPGNAPIDTYVRYYTTIADAEADYAKGAIAEATIAQVRLAFADGRPLACEFTRARESACSCCSDDLPWGNTLCSNCARSYEDVMDADETVSDARDVPYERNGVGCCLHIALDDHNLSDGDLDFCVTWAQEKGHPFCEGLAKAIRAMSLVERYRLCNLPDTGPE